MKKNILFVDDEPNVLQGLKRMLHGMRREWHMAFVQSGAAALAAMEQSGFDVVVTDMRMPEMSGDVLLAHIRERYPETVRLVLSGYSDAKLIMGSVQLAHQYISKPVSPEELKKKINRACALLELLEKPALRSIVSSMEAIPTLPHMFFEITGELEKEEASMKKIGEMISRDPAMTAKILQIVNSSFFSLPRTIKSPAEAVNLLGLDTVTSLVLTLEIFSKFDRQKLEVFDIERLWDHSVRTGTLARQIAAHGDMDKTTIDNACMAGLLHDVGKLVFMDNFIDPYQEALAMAGQEQIPLHEAEIRIFGATHCQIGAYLLGIWGLPGNIVETVGFHHMPEDLPDSTNRTLQAVYLANAFALYDEAETEISELISALNPDYLREAGMLEHLEAYDEIRRNMLAGENGNDG